MSKIQPVKSPTDAGDILDGMHTVLNSQFMCMVERILENKVNVGDMLQVAQDVPCLLHSTPVNEAFPSDMSKYGQIHLKGRRMLHAACVAHRHHLVAVLPRDLDLQRLSQWCEVGWHRCQCHGAIE
jgi:hypothetical protein